MYDLVLEQEYDRLFTLDLYERSTSAEQFVDTIGFYYELVEADNDPISIVTLVFEVNNHIKDQEYVEAFNNYTAKTFVYSEQKIVQTMRVYNYSANDIQYIKDLLHQRS